jgi:hypothetical protein
VVLVVACCLGEVAVPRPPSAQPTIPPAPHLDLLKLSNLVYQAYILYGIVL